LTEVGSRTTLSYMSHQALLNADNRRLSPRFPVRATLNEYIAEEEAPGIALDVSMAGLALRTAPMEKPRETTVVAVEVELPGTGEAIWASAQPRFHAIGPGYDVSGLLFLDMARKHRRLLHDYVNERRERWRRLFGPRPVFTSRFGCLI
jgi:hypothetical protein